MNFTVKGNIIHIPEIGNLELYENSYIVVVNGRVSGIYETLPMEYNHLEVLDYGDKLIIPSFVDLHLHAVQYANMGLGLDLELLPWLKAYTYPEEEKFANLEYAERIFSHLIYDLYRFGSLRSCIFSSLHADATILLMKMLEEAGLSAYVGKTNMDRNSIGDLQETKDQSMDALMRILNEYKSIDGRIKPIITPRFIPSCTDELLELLGQLAEERDLAVQSHLNENKKEVEWVKELVPESKNYLDAYTIRGLVRNSKTIMAHSIYNTEEELAEIIGKGIFIAHCPSSNMNLTSGIMKTKKMMNLGVNMGLGSDIAAGDSLKINDVMVDAIKASKILSLYSGDESDILSVEDVFYLSTRGGGKFFGDVGSFKNGYSFDALIIDDNSYNFKDSAGLKERLEMFIYRGDDRNIVDRFLEGRRLSII
ncbi:amidohydrolase family protein [Microaceticoccus formicicus]|uniref:amidohydrolase family protein n=1 Tax=Microaceticoccus formicicus TaxID=3118105 RepID=UPI003CD0162E|nr:amidohydrolase family protein [Peptoniphilaceae bacterium AMB_02]